MTRAEIRELYKHAYFLSRTFFISGYAQEDLLQECVIAAWKAASNAEKWNWQFVRLVMHSRLIDLWRGRDKIHYEIYKVPIEWNDPILLQLPDNKEQVQMLRLFIELGSIKECTETLGFTYTKGAKLLTKARKHLVAQLEA